MCVDVLGTGYIDRTHVYIRENERVKDSLNMCGELLIRYKCHTEGSSTLLYFTCTLTPQSIFSRMPVCNSQPITRHEAVFSFRTAVSSTPYSISYESFPTVQFPLAPSLLPPLPILSSLSSIPAWIQRTNSTPLVLKQEESSKKRSTQRNTERGLFRGNGRGRSVFPGVFLYLPACL